MKRFQVSVPHVVIGLAALAMTATTMALAVVVPATSDCPRHEVRTVAAAPRTSVDIVPGRIEVVAFRGAATAPRALVGAASTRHQG